MQTIELNAELPGRNLLSSLVSRLKGDVPAPEPVEEVIITVSMITLINEFFADNGKNMRASTNSDNELVIDDYNLNKRRALDEETINKLAQRVQKHIEELSAKADKDMLS